MAEDKDFLPRPEQNSEDMAVRRVRTRRIPTASTEGTQATSHGSTAHPRRKTTQLQILATAPLGVHDPNMPTTATAHLTIVDTPPRVNAHSTTNATKPSVRVATTAISTTAPKGLARTKVATHILARRRVGSPLREPQTRRVRVEARSLVPSFHHLLLSTRR